MSNAMLEIKDLHATIESGEEILTGLDLTILPGETHVIMGPNGAGKSTLSHVVMGSGEYEVTEGSIEFEGEDILEDSTDARAKRGLYLSFQAPEEVDGITVENFLRTAKMALSDKPIKIFAFRKELEEAMRILDFDDVYANRYLNVGFSGGEKKKSEILQLLVLKPKLAILDETDSGLDVDAVKIVTDGVRNYKKEDNALLVISHSTKLLDNLDVDYVHILVDGKIVHTGRKDLIDLVNKEGFARFGKAENLTED